MNQIWLPQFCLLILVRSSNLCQPLHRPLPTLSHKHTHAHTHTHTHTQIITWSDSHRRYSLLKHSLCLRPLYRSWRLVSPRLRQIPVVGGGLGEADPDHGCCYAGPIRQLRLADGLPVDVQRHGTQLETTPAGRQLRGNCPAKISDQNGSSDWRSITWQSVIFIFHK